MMEAFLTIVDGAISGRVPINVKGRCVSCRPLRAIGCDATKKDSIKSMEHDISLFFRIHGVAKARRVLQDWGWIEVENRLILPADPEKWEWKEWDEMIDINVGL